MEIYENTTVFVYCPADTETGGTLLLHQLAECLMARGVSVRMTYFGAYRGDNPCPAAYRIYNIPQEERIPDLPQHILILPEVACAPKGTFIRMIRWWLSVDNWAVQIQSMLLDGSAHSFQEPLEELCWPSHDADVFHWVQSRYAYDFLVRNGVAEARIAYVGDYLDPVFLSRHGKDVDSPRENWVAFNPKKGAEFTGKLIQAAPDLAWIKLADMTPEDVENTLSRAKVYIDFGNHPGKDRIPREAALCGCCILTSRRGSAGNAVDVPIPEAYKIEDCEENIPRILACIRELLRDYGNHIHDFADYREQIRGEHEAFVRDVCSALPFAVPALGTGLLDAMPRSADFPYPMEYFSCKDVDEDRQSFIQNRISSYMAMDSAIGTLTGETGIEGMLLDFNNGVRLQVPKGAFHVRIGDSDSGLVFYEADVSEKLLVSVEKYFVRWQIDVWKDGVLVFSHTFDPTGQRVHFVFASSRLGDTLANLPYLADFITRYHVEASCYAAAPLRGLIRLWYPHLPFREHIADDTYATFYFTAGLKDASKTPIDGRFLPMCQLGQMILALPEPRRLPPLPFAVRRIREPYVCIGVQATSSCKAWLYPNGWEEIVAALKEQGYRVLCIDKERSMVSDGIPVQLPVGAEDFTGAVPLEERAELLAHAAFFIGLASGLSWLAWAVHCPVVLIGGFSAVWCEFPTKYRVFNRMACHGCYNDARWYWPEMPCHLGDKDPARRFECQRTITPRMVWSAITRLIEDRSKERAQ